MNYQDQISKVRLKKLLPRSVFIFLGLLLVLVLIALFPGPETIVLATMLVLFAVILQAWLILKDQG